ncbi:MAG: lipocalin family protein [Prevotellaceae bacterium]|nr:lipocalin family protein [Prevotellaceae bacterium]
MKRAASTLIHFLAITILLSGCTDNPKKTQEKEDMVVLPMTEIPDIVETTGKVGDGTSMNVLELVEESGDTLLINVPVSTITGGAESGDDIDIIYTVASNGDMTASVVVNLTALQHLWTQPNGKGGMQSLELNSNGKAATYGMSIEYDSWKLENGMLLLHSPKIIGEEKGEIVDTFHIMKLTDDELVLMSHEMESVFKRSN